MVTNLYIQPEFSGYDYERDDYSHRPHYRWKLCIYKNGWTQQYWHRFVPSWQSCPTMTDNELVYQVLIP
ncbi:hypothetical protein [Bacillus thuringiensis]|uniref:Uncharacterized protein n=1 Tax=Bacillus thuringiensis TaxID=1428 RepID=A0A9W3VGM3_BACTU|nr:hypothetical protein [Bacillus thuringiensis]AMR06176.1 hypothetical protein AXW78_30635 [Bacillus thuringiensis]AYF84896.1 hypothetical protein D7J84_28155 [Bacillus thuringiensis]PNK35395.1 hypothetical protein CBR55_25365 [Bacillus thuringiensis]